MKKIIKLCMVCFLAISLAACGSGDEKDAKKAVSSYVDYLLDRDFVSAAALTGETYDPANDENEMYQRKNNLMLNRLDYSIQDVSINGNDGVITIEITNVPYTNFLTTSMAKLETQEENFDELSNEDKEIKLVELMESLLPDTEVVTQTVSAYVTKDGDTWKLAKDNQAFYKAINGE